MLKFRFERKPDCLMLNRRIPNHPNEKFDMVIVNDVIYSPLFIEQLREMTTMEGQCHLMDIPLCNYWAVLEAIPEDEILYGRAGDNISDKNWTIWRSVGGWGAIAYQVNCRLNNGQHVFHWFTYDAKAKRRQQFNFAGGFLTTRPSELPQYFKILRSLIQHPKVIKCYNW